MKGLGDSSLALLQLHAVDHATALLHEARVRPLAWDLGRSRVEWLQKVYEEDAEFYEEVRILIQQKRLIRAAAAEIERLEREIARLERQNEPHPTP